MESFHRNLTSTRPGPDLDEYAGYYHGPRAAASTRRWLLADHQGSIVAYTDDSAETVVINTYDEYGRAGPANAERLQYTGQFTLSPGLDLINYRNRFYNPRLGRFMQIDPILYGDGLNLYGYVGNDPMNRVDPWGLLQVRTIQEWRCTAVYEDGGITATCGWTIVGVTISDYFPGSPDRIGPGGDRITRPVPLPECPTGTYVEGSAGYGASGAVGGKGGTGSVSGGFSLSTQSWRGAQLFLRLRGGAGGGTGQGFQHGVEAGGGTRQGALTQGSSFQGQAFTEVSFAGMAINASNDLPSGAPGQSVSGDIRARGGQGAGAFQVTGVQGIYTAATPPLGCTP